jgi:hypothetical protein
VKTLVEVGAANDTQTTVTGGIAPGDTLVVDRNPAIVDNIAVKPAPSPAPKPSNGAT